MILSDVNIIVKHSLRPPVSRKYYQRVPGASFRRSKPQEKFPRSPPHTLPTYPRCIAIQRIHLLRKLVLREVPKYKHPHNECARNAILCPDYHTKVAFGCSVWEYNYRSRRLLEREMQMNRRVEGHVEPTTMCQQTVRIQIKVRTPLDVFPYQYADLLRKKQTRKETDSLNCPGLWVRPARFRY